MTANGDDRNPYKPPVASATVVSSERRKRPLTYAEIAIGVVLAIIAGGITFVATCGGLGFLAFAALYPSSWFYAAYVACWVIPIIVGIASASFTAIRWNRSRKD